MKTTYAAELRRAGVTRNQLYSGLYAARIAQERKVGAHWFAPADAARASIRQAKKAGK